MPVSSDRLAPGCRPKVASIYVTAQLFHEALDMSGCSLASARKACPDEPA